MAKPQLTQQRESADHGLETTNEHFRDIHDFEKKAEAVEREPNRSTAEKIEDLRGNIERNKQWEEITAFTTAAVSVIAKVLKEDGNIDKIRANPTALHEEVALRGVNNLKLPERAALDELPRIFGELGDTSNYLRGAWSDIVEQGEAASKGIFGKAKKFAKEHPVGAVGIGIAAVAGIYLSYQAISSFFKAKEGKLGEKMEKAGGTGSFFKTRVLPAIGLLVAGSLLGKEAAAALFGKPDLGQVEELLKKGDAIPAEMRKKLEDQAERLRALEEKKAGIAGTYELGRTKIDQAGETIKETAEDPVAQFGLAKKAFYKMNFYHRRVFTGDYEVDIKTCISDLKTIEVNELIELHEQYKEDGRIPPSAFPVNAEKIEAEHLFILVAGIIDVHKVFYNDKTSNETVESLFIRSVTDPVYKMNDTFHIAVIANLEKGNLTEAFDEIDYKSVEAEMKNKGGEFIDELQPRTALYETLTDTEKTALRQIQVSLYTNTNINFDSDVAVDTAMREIPGNLKGAAANPDVKLAATEFFENIHKQTEKLVPRIQERFGISEIGGEQVDNLVAKKINMERLTTAHAIQLLVVAKGINWSEAEQGNIHWMKDLAMLNVVLRALDPTSRDLYIGQLTKLGWESNADFKIPIPGLENLAPYISKTAEFAKNKALDKGYGVLYKALAWMKGRPSDETIEDRPFVSFGSEAVGGTLEIATDTLALIVATAGITPEEMGAVEDGNDFFDLIFSKGGDAVYPFDEETGGVKNPGVIALHIYGKYFFTKPLGILADSFNNVVDGDFSGAAKMWVVGSAPFMVIGGVGGAMSKSLKPGYLPKVFGTAKGIGKGLAYPVYGPWLGAKYAYKATKGVATGIAGGAEYIKRPARITGDAWRWTSEKAKYGIGKQSVGNMLRNGQDLQYFAKNSTTISSVTSKKRFVEIFTSPGKALRRLPEHFHRMMAVRYASKFANNYHNFFDFDVNPLMSDKKELAKSLNIVKGSINDTSERIERFFRTINSDPGNYEELRRIFRAKSPNIASDLERFFLKMRLADVEAVALRKKIKAMKSEKQLDKFIRQLSEESRFLDKKGFFAKAGEKFKKARQKLRGKVKPGEVAEVGSEGRAAAAVAEAAIIEEAITKATSLGKGKFQYMGDEFKLKEADIATQAKKMGGDRAAAIDKLCHKKWATPTRLKDVKGGRMYRYRGADVFLTETEYSGQGTKGIKAACEARFVEAIKITDVRTVRGKQQFKINGEWVKTSEKPKSISALKTEYLDELKKAGKPIEGVNLGTNPKLLKYMEPLKRMLGPSVAALFIYHLETAEDKRQAVAESAIGLGTFMAGAKATERATRAWTPKTITGNLGKGGLILAGGMASALGITEPIADIVEDLWPHFVGEQQMSLEIISLIEKHTGRSLIRTAFASLEKGVLKKGIERVGLKALSGLLTKKIESTVLKKVAGFATKSLTKKLAVSLGVRGATLAALLADDATVIGILDDVVAVGMAIWMAKDIYDIAVLTNKALKVKGAMETYNAMPIANIKPSTEVDKKAIEAEMAVRGKTMEEMTDDELMEVIQSIPDIKLKITRKGASGYEEYRFVRGEVWSTKIKTESGEILELSDEELNQDISMPPPEEFKTWEIDYNQPSEQLQANLRLALMYTKSECGWTKMDHNIVDDKTIELNRLDGKGALTITRDGNTWSVEGYKTGLDLFQAAALGNLVNKVENILIKNRYSGGSTRPFEIDGGNIDFDKAGSPIDLTIMSGDLGWADFYEKIDLDTKTITDALNEWYRADYYAQHAI